MKTNSKLKQGLGAFVLAFALFGMPNAPGSAFVPTVGGNAHAYAPCASEYTAMQVAWNDANRWGGWFAETAAWQETFDYLSCRF